MSTQPTICTKSCVPFVTNKESRNPQIVRALRNFGYRVFHCNDIKPSMVPCWLLDEYSKSEVRIIDKNGLEYCWSDNLFVPPWYLFEKGGADKYDNKCRDWVRKTFFKKIPYSQKLRISAKYRYTFRCVTTLILCARPDLANLVPRLQQANCMMCALVETRKNKNNLVFDRKISLIEGS